MRRRTTGTYNKVEGQYYGTPKELWGFRTSPQEGRPEAVARSFLRKHADELGLKPDLDTIEHQHTYTSLGARHVIFQQKYRGLRVHRAYVTVHIDRDGRVYLCKNRAMPVAMLPRELAGGVEVADATRAAIRALPRRRTKCQTTEHMWYPRGRELVPSYRVRLARRSPGEEWIIYVDARSGEVLHKYNNIAYAARGRATIFDPSPVIALDGHDELLDSIDRQKKPPESTYKTVTLWSLKGNGYLDGKRVTTRLSKSRVKRSKHKYFLTSRDKGFEEVMVYHHIDSVIRYLENLGFKGGNRVFDDPVKVDVNGTTRDHSEYSPWEQRLLFGTGHIDDAEDGETIVHELGHAIQDAIVPDFGQSYEAAAMGEGFGDYLAASCFAEKKSARYKPCVMCWDGLYIGLDEGSDPPCIRRVDSSKDTRDFIDEDEEEHANGEIWSATLWDIRTALGRETADQMIVESHWELDGFTTFARGARAIINADEHLNGSVNEQVLRSVFDRRHVGPI